VAVVGGASSGRTWLCRCEGRGLLACWCMSHSDQSRLLTLWMNMLKGSTCYCAAQDLLSSRLLSQNIKIKIYRNIILSVAVYGCESRSVR
jgi:hypothetical protein